MSRYPTCSTCRHHASGIVAGHCTTFVPLPEGADKWADYCNCNCTEDPRVKAWLADRAIPIKKMFLVEIYSRGYCDHIPDPKHPDDPCGWTFCWHKGCLDLQF